MSWKVRPTLSVAGQSWILPFGLAGHPWEYPFAAGFAGILIVIYLAQLATPAAVVITTVGLLPVLASVWLLSLPLALGVAVLGIGLLALAGATGELLPATAVAEAAVYAILAIVIRLYAGRLVIALRGSPGDTKPGLSMVFGLESLAGLVDASIDGVTAVDQRGRIVYANAAVGEILGVPRESLLGNDFLSYVVTDDRPSFGAYLATTGHRQAGRLTVRALRSDGEVRELEVSHTLIAAPGELAVAISCRDITETNRFRRTMTALAQTATNLAVTQPIERMLEALAGNVVEATGAVAAGVFVLEGERSLRTAGTAGLPPDYIAAMDAASQAGAHRPALEAILTRADVIDEDLPARILSDTDFAPAHAVVKDVPWKLVVTVPVMLGGRTLGALSAYFPPAHRPSEPTMTFLHTIAGLAAFAAELSRLATASQDRVALEERQRLSRELHDSVSQALYGIALGAHSAMNRMKGSRERLAEPLDYIMGLADAALADMRTLILELRPEALEQEGLVGAMRQRSDALMNRYGVEVTADLPDEPTIPLDLKQTIYRIAQEALHNVVKHSHAKHATLRLAIDGDAVILEVIDDGQGFDTSDSFPGHLGLQSMRERVRSHAGELDVVSSHGNGTRVHARIPLPALAASTSRMAGSIPDIRATGASVG